MTTQLTAAATAAPPQGDHRRLDIQGLRALAVLLVVLFHAGLPVPGGFVGVDIFFVISGFVITAMLARDWAMRGQVRFRTFYLRRFLRLTPALSLVIVVVAAASVLLQSPFGPQQTTARTGLGATLLSANYVIAQASGDYFTASAITNPLLHTWSLSVEEQFYLVFPALLVGGWLLAQRRSRRLAPFAITGAIALASFAVSLAWSQGSSLATGLTSIFGGPQSLAYYSSLTRAWEFAAGALLALALHRFPVLAPRQARLLGLGGGVALLAAAFLINDTLPFPGFAALVPVVGTLLLILAGAHHVVGLNRALSLRPVVALGDLSYSWYLWHWPAIVFTALLFPQRPVALVIAAAASLLPAVASYRWVEQPLRRWRPRSRLRLGTVVLATLALPLALCLTLLLGANRGWGMAPPAAPTSTGLTTSAQTSTTQTSTEQTSTSGPTGTAADATGTAPDALATDGDVGGSLRSQHAIVRADCVNTPLTPSRCRFGPTDATGTVLLAGDSQAYALGDGVIAAAERIGWDVVATSHTGCPLLARESSGTHDYPCAAWQRSIIDWALAERPNAVVIANLSSGYVNPETGWRTAVTDSGGRASTVDEATRLWRAGLEPVVRELDEAGIPVIVIASVPQMTGYTDRTSLVSFGSSFQILRADAERDRRPAWDVEQELAATYSAVQVLDPIPVLCDETVCSTERDGAPVYQDETHLSLSGSLLLTDTVAEALSRAASSLTPGDAPN